MSPGPDLVQLSWAGDRHLRLSLAPDGAPDASLTARCVRAVYEAVHAARIPGLRDLTPAYTTILLTFDLAGLDHGSIEVKVREALRDPRLESGSGAARTVAVPVCYDERFAPDLADVARLHNLTPAEVIALHAAAEYTVLFLGFSPGFPYLAGLPAALATPRLDRPRTRIPAGSIGIAADQTGIYPHATPGGWRLIGRTPLRLFDPRRDPPSLLVIGDRVRFTPIDPGQFEAIAAKASTPSEGA